MSNALAREKSPYLLQHADNPVDWRPWGEEAFAKARAEQKPIFLSIGYSTCHWCHVMAHESFEDAGTAAILNEHFVAIKVDREERPDVDRVYMTYVQALTGHGGWPLSAWLTPELKPFYGGTYFPPDERHGRPSFSNILRSIARGWQEQREQLVAESERVIGLLREAQQKSRAESSESRADQPASEKNVSGSQLSALDSQLAAAAAAAGPAFERGFQHFYESFDAKHGGFGGAPKFPRAANLNFLFRIAAIQGKATPIGSESIRLASATLRAMTQGGIHDHVGGGFHRYAVDEAWFVPHFEKMLYDQAQIALNALEAKQATGDERYAWLARNVFDYVLRDLAHRDGGFYTAEDADSAVAAGGVGAGERLEARGERTKPDQAHAEGAFYVWTKAEIVAALDRNGGAVPSPRGTEPAEKRGEGIVPPLSQTPSIAEFFCTHYGVRAEGNVPEQLDPHGELRGKNILMQRQPLAASAAACGLDVEAANEKLVAALATLRELRARRPRPLLDDKIITANNGLMISALAKAHQILEMETPAAAKFLTAATRAAEFVERELFDAQRGVLFRSWREGRGAAEGFAEDYAFLIQGLLDLYEASFEIRWLQWAERLQSTMDELFWDAVGGYFNSPANDPSIVLRLKEDYDGAEPAPSSVAAMNLLRLAALFDHGGAVPPPRGSTPAGEGTRPPLNSNPILSYRARGLRTLEAFRPQWSEAPHALPQMLCALELALEPPRHVVIAGTPGADDFRALTAVLHEKSGPRRSLLAVDGGAAQRWLAERAPWLAEMKPVAGRATVYLCEEFACQPPITDPPALRRVLGG